MIYTKPVSHSCASTVDNFTTNLLIITEQLILILIQCTVSVTEGFLPSASTVGPHLAAEDQDSHAQALTLDAVHLLTD